MNPNPAITYTPGTDSTTMQKAVIAAARSLEGRARLRTLGVQEVKDFLAVLDRNDPAIETVRVYSYEGFVANAYDYPAYISTAEAKRQPNGEYIITVWRAGAQRTRGIGPRMTINNKAVS